MMTKEPYLMDEFNSIQMNNRCKGIIPNLRKSYLSAMIDNVKDKNRIENVTFDICYPKCKKHYHHQKIPTLLVKGHFED